ncbi:stem 28 kDa glycoprotein-like [Solanum lycopersicum]|uniref:stem 28 kDa glycoprotein-like n=1 Tax=Solanum lycopersicum TaxID=4081 RepID=UPI0008FEB7BB|nr:stem 28 kDa glycoprotein-like [Solanum lycopersicum]
MALPSNVPPQLDCLSWRLAVETNNLHNRKLVPKEAIALNSTKFIEWLAEGKLPVIPSILGVYKTLLSLRIKPVLNKGAPENFRQSRIANLKKAGYSNWLKLGGNDSRSAVEYKSIKRTELVKAGYRIVGNIGDQWTDF